VSTLRSSAELLARADSLEALVPIASAVGCTGVAASVDEDTRRHLGLESAALLNVSVSAGRGARRALLLEISGSASMRELLPRVATQLSARAPHILWLVVATQSGGTDIAIAAWSDDRRPPRVAALVANRARIVDSDAETLRALIAAHGAHDVLTHARWVEVLGRETLTRRFYHTLERLVGEIAASSAVGSAEVRERIALLYVSRLLFLAFLEAKGWLDGDHAFLARRFDECMTSHGGFHRRVLLPLFFGTLNTPLRCRAPAARRFGRVPFLNGGLFARSAVERRATGLAFSDESYGALLHDLFAQYRFTAREETASWSEVAIDPEMLGKAFESLMASRERKSTGAYFTPQHLVEVVTSSGLERAVAHAAGDAAAESLMRGATLGDADAARVRTALAQLAILDPACGSGAFLVHALERVAALLSQLGDGRSIAELRRDLLTRSIFGVDINPTAVWLCELRLWLSVVVESDESEPGAVHPLPNIDHNIRVGDALAGRAFADTPIVVGSDELGALRRRYACATGTRKESLARRLEQAERRRMLLTLDADLDSLKNRRRDLVSARRGRDLFGHRRVATHDEQLAALDLRRQAAALRQLRRRTADGGALPFSFPAQFADVAARGGFDLIVGNPPWVRLHRVPPAARAAFRRRYLVARYAAWEHGAASASAGRGFAAQVDVAALFVERALRLLAPGAAMALLLPAKLWRSLAGGGMRRLLATDAELRQLDDYSDASLAFDAAVYPSLVVACRARSGHARATPLVRASIHTGGAGGVRWQMRADGVSFDESPGAPWLVLPPDVRRAFDLLRDAGRPLAQTALGRPLLGVKCGCNDAFVVRTSVIDMDVSAATARDGRTGLIERALLRPLVHGEELYAWSLATPKQSIVWTHDARGAPLATLPPHAARWLSHWRRQLANRADARRAARWWSLFRIEGARHDRPRVVWADLGRTPRAAIIAAGDDTVALNSCYVVRCRTERDALALATLLNSPLAAAWLNVLAEPARGGYRRYLGWTMSLLPVPADWNRACELLAPIGLSAVNATHRPSTHELLEASLAAYDVSHREVAPLIAWTAEWSAR